MRGGSITDDSAQAARERERHRHINKDRQRDREREREREREIICTKWKWQEKFVIKLRFQVLSPGPPLIETIFFTRRTKRTKQIKKIETIRQKWKCEKRIQYRDLPVSRRLPYLFCHGSSRFTYPKFSVTYWAIMRSSHKIELRLIAVK